MKQVVFLVHGIGANSGGPVGHADREAWAREVIDQITAAAKSYPKFVEADLVIEPILYDDVFMNRVQTWSELADQLVGSPLAPLVSWMRGADDPSFMWTDLADIVQYRAFEPIRAQVHTHVARQLAEAVEKHGTGTAASYSIVAHSLGTAVAHDAVQKLATTGIDGNTALQPPGFTFANFFALANVSRLVWATDDAFYNETRVRPPGSGLPLEQCAVRHYVTARHVADPIPSVIRFTRKSWSTEHFHSVEVRHVRQANVHSFTHYMASPWIMDRLLYRLFGSGIIVPQVMLKRLQAFPDYVGPRASALRTAVDTVEAALNAISAQAEGKFQLDLDDLGKAAWTYRAEIARAFGDGAGGA